MAVLGRCTVSRQRTLAALFSIDLLTGSSTAGHPLTGSRIDRSTRGEPLHTHDHLLLIHLSCCCAGPSGVNACMAQFDHGTAHVRSNGVLAERSTRLHLGAGCRPQRAAIAARAEGLGSEWRRFCTRLPCCHGPRKTSTPRLMNLIAYSDESRRALAVLGMTTCRSSFGPKIMIRFRRLRLPHCRPPARNRTVR
jgi:hypothetical protein